MEFAQNPARRRMLGYCRVSTLEQAQGGVSLEAQEERIRAYCAAYDLELLEVIQDGGASAKTLDRDGLQNALNLLFIGEADGLIVYKLDRLTRSVSDLGRLIDEYFGEHAVRQATLLSVTDHIDTDTASGRLLLNVLTATSQWEREAAAERTKEALRHLRARGVRLGSEPLGWRRLDEEDDQDRKCWRRVKGEQETVKVILGLREGGNSLRSIAETLMRQGRTTKRGGKWHPSTVRQILSRELARRGSSETRG